MPWRRLERMDSTHVMASERSLALMVVTERVTASQELAEQRVLG